METAIYVRISKDATGERAGLDRQERDCRALVNIAADPNQRRRVERSHERLSRLIEP